jgi:hypothetical protein
MFWYQINAYVHVMSTVLIVGYALFWIIMARALRQRVTASESTRLLGLINQGRWPPGGLPSTMRLPFPGLAWAFLFVLIATGIFLHFYHGVTLEQVVSSDPPARRFAQLLLIKHGLIAVLLIVNLRLAFHATRWLIHANFLLALMVVGISTLLVR